MKRNLTLFSLLSITLMSTTNLQAQTVSACIHDAFDYHWTFTITVTGAKYSGKGNVIDFGGYKWKAKIKGTSLVSTTLTAINPNPDGCATHTDDFVYQGNATAGLFYGTEFRYDGSGTWADHCGGVLNNSGVWAATDCYHNPFGPKSNIKIRPGEISVASLIRVTPNPVNSQATVSYALTKSGKVNITIYNSMQQAVKVLVNDFKNAGSYSMVWDTKTANINSGVYRVVAVVDGKTYSTTVQVVK